MMNYVVVGRGDAPESVITDSLLDLGRDTHFYVPWIGGTSTRPSEGMRKVYDFLVDTKATFTLIAKDRSAVHASLLSACVVVKECGSDQPDTNFVNVPPDATVLMLWDDEHSEGHEWMACEYFDRGHALLDLTNGMIPIEIESSTTTPLKVVEDSPIQEDEIEPLTDDEVDSLPAGVRKQLDRALGDNTTLVEQDLKEMDEAEVVNNVLQFVRGEKETDDSVFATLVVILPTGKAFTTAVPMLELWSLLDATVWSD